MNESGDANAPLRGPTFAVVAPTVGVVIVLVVLALRACSPSLQEDAEAPRGGRIAAPAAVVLAASDGAAIP